MLAPVVVLWVALGGALGAVLRHAADGAAQRWSPRVAELGVLGANLVASAVLGFLAGGEVLLGSVPGEAPMAPTLTASRILGVNWWLLGAGLAGALSTFSTAVVQVARRVRACRSRWPVTCSWPPKMPNSSPPMSVSGWCRTAD